MITTSRENDYVLNKVVGNVTIKDLVEYAQKNMEIWLSDPVLWDLSEANMKEEESDYAAVQFIVRSIHDMAEKRKGRRTVFFTPDPFSFGMLRKEIAIVECCESRLVASVFNDIKTAKTWLMKPIEDQSEI